MNNPPRQKRSKSDLIKVSEVINIVKDSLGLEKSFKIQALKELWPLVTSFDIAKHSQPAYFDRENNLVIAVTSGALAMELSMKKNNILECLKQATKNTDLSFKDIRFINKSS